MVNGTHSQVRTATAVVRPSSRSYAKQPSSAEIAVVLIYSLTRIDTSVENSLARRQPDFDTSKWWGDGTPAWVTSPQPIINERVFLQTLRAVSRSFCGLESYKLRSRTSPAPFFNYQLAVKWVMDWYRKRHLPRPHLSKQVAISLHTWYIGSKVGKGGISTCYQLNKWSESEDGGRREEDGGLGWERGRGTVSSLTIPTPNQPLFISFPHLSM